MTTTLTLDLILLHIAHYRAHLAWSRAFQWWDGGDTHVDYLKADALDSLLDQDMLHYDTLLNEYRLTTNGWKTVDWLMAKRREAVYG